MKRFIRVYGSVRHPDYNIDLSKQTSDTKVCNYINEIFSSGCYSLINKPTRINSTSATTLDHVYTNSLHRVAVAGVLILDISGYIRRWASYCKTLASLTTSPFCKLHTSVNVNPLFSALRRVHTEAVNVNVTVPSQLRLTSRCSHRKF